MANDCIQIKFSSLESQCRPPPENDPIKLLMTSFAWLKEPEIKFFFLKKPHCAAAKVAFTPVSGGSSAGGKRAENAGRLRGRKCFP